MLGRGVCTPSPGWARPSWGGQRTERLPVAGRGPCAESLSAQQSGEASQALTPHLRPPSCFLSGKRACLVKSGVCFLQPDPLGGGAVLVSPRPFSPISALDLPQNTLTPPASPGHPAWRGRLCWPSVKRSLVGPLASGMEGVGGLCVCCISWRRDQGAQVWGQGPGEPREGPGGAVPSCPFALCCQVSPSGTFGSFYGSHLCSTVTCWLHPALFPGPPCPLLAEPQLSTCSASWNHLNSLDALFNKNLCQCQGHIPLFIATS